MRLSLWKLICSFLTRFSGTLFWITDKIHVTISRQKCIAPQVFYRFYTLFSWSRNPRNVVTSLIPAWLFVWSSEFITERLRNVFYNQALQIFLLDIYSTTTRNNSVVRSIGIPLIGFSIILIGNFSFSFDKIPIPDCILVSCNAYSQMGILAKEDIQIT